MEFCTYQPKQENYLCLSNQKTLAMLNKMPALVIAVLVSLQSLAQINLESTYNHSGTFTQLALSGNKFFLMDVANNQVRLYHTDHSLWKTVSLAVPANHYLYDVRYVSENLFSTDNSLALAYTYYHYDEVNEYYTYTTKVINENGTELLSIPACVYVMVMENADLGTKMLAYIFDYSVFPYTVQTHVYNLPGSLVQLSESAVGGKTGTAKAYPNPTSHATTIHYVLAESSENSKLLLFDAHGKKLKTIALDTQKNEVQLSTAGFPPGSYHYVIQSGGRLTNSGKIIVN